MRINKVLTGINLIITSYYVPDFVIDIVWLQTSEPAASEKFFYSEVQPFWRCGTGSSLRILASSAEYCLLFCLLDVPLSRGC